METTGRDEGQAELIPGGRKGVSSRCSLPNYDGGDLVGLENENHFHPRHAPLQCVIYGLRTGRR